MREAEVQRNAVAEAARQAASREEALKTAREDASAALERARGLHSDLEETRRF